MALGDNIKRLREERQLTQQMLADKLYVSRQTVCRWENGSRCPDLIMAKKLAVELNISLDELISDEDVDQFTKKGFPFHSDKVKERKVLEERQKRVMEQLEMRVPMWCFILALCLEAAAFIARYRIAKKLNQLY